MAKESRVVTCAEHGCKESALFQYDSRREARESDAKRGKWKCLRHSSPNEVLSAEARVTRVELINEQKPYGHFWGGRSGFMHGPGFMAYADDFPPGTKLIVTAEVVLPESQNENKKVM